jgi:hypothetical protein
VYYTKVIEDSIPSHSESNRLTSIEVRYPHAVHKDLLTHCMLERNFLSFRAYPPERVIAMVEETPFIPEQFTSREKGMNIGKPLDDAQQDLAANLWLGARDNCVTAAKQLLEIGVDKAQINVLLQDFCWITGIFTATEWDNFFALRAFAPEGSKPRPEVEKIARMMYEAREESTPNALDVGEWHLPYVPFGLRKLLTVDAQKQISAGRTARVSYLTHDGNTDLVADSNLSDGLVKNGHMSPFGHQATPIDPDVRWVMEHHGKFRGWRQARKEIPYESNFKLVSGVKF